MPTYEYQCRKCGHRFEVFQSIVDPPIRDCPKCRCKGSVEQLISGGSGLIFKGSGFYETDYKRKPGGSKTDSDSGGSGSSSDKPASPKPKTDSTTKPGK